MASRTIHLLTTFADPYLRCDQCLGWVTGWHDNFTCGCRTPSDNKPCGHPAGVTSACPSWSPVDGCQCQAMLGYVPHEEPPGGHRG